MGLRIIVRTVDAGAAANVGGPVQETYRTFEINAYALETFLRAAEPPASGHSYINRQVVGAELLPQEGP